MIKSKGVLLVIILGVLVSIIALKKWDWLLYGAFLLCPLMHLFGHNHAGHNGDSNEHKH